MSNEYTIVLNITETEGTVAIDQLAELGIGESDASFIAHELYAAVEREVRRVKSSATEICAEYAKASKTIH
ncbi:hypothetical protein D9M71_749630 [compost metagenome]